MDTTIFTKAIFSYIIVLVMKMENEDVVPKILSILDELRPFLISDGGNIEFVKF